MRIQICSSQHVIDLFTLNDLIVIRVNKIESNMQVFLIDQLSTVVGSRRELIVINFSIVVDVDCIECCIPVGTVSSQLIAQQLINRLHASLNLILV